MYKKEHRICRAENACSREHIDLSSEQLALEMGPCGFSVLPPFFPFVGEGARVRKKAASAQL